MVKDNRGGEEAPETETTGNGGGTANTRYNADTHLPLPPSKCQQKTTHYDNERT